MERLKIRIDIPFADAVRKGSNMSGYFYVQPTLEELQSLTPEERELLASAPRYTNTKLDEVIVHLDQFGTSTAADFSAVRPLLAAMAAKRAEDAAAKAREKAAEAARQLAEAEARAPLIRTLIDQVRTNAESVVFASSWGDNASRLSQVSRVGVDKARLVEWRYALSVLLADAPDVVDRLETEYARREENRAARETAQQAARVAEEQRQVEETLAFVRRHGAPDQVERMEEDLLPKPELYALARRVLFQPLADFTPYVPDELRMRRRQEADALPAAAWAIYKQIRAVVTSSMTNATCTPEAYTYEDEDGEDRIEYAALVEMEWNGIALSVGYRLE